jgi:hypothetical protein
MQNFQELPKLALAREAMAPQDFLDLGADGSLIHGSTNSIP